MKTVEETAIKFYARRDSATAALRKLGLNPRDYDLFIEKLADGRIACQLGRAQLHLEDLEKKRKDSVRKSIQKAKDDGYGIYEKEPKPAASTKPKSKPKSISQFIRDLILDDKDNAEIFAALQQEYGADRFDESRKHYPAWYRCEMRRRGVLPPAFDTVRRDPNVTRQFEE